MTTAAAAPLEWRSLIDLRSLLVNDHIRIRREKSYYHHGIVVTAGNTTDDVMIVNFTGEPVGELWQIKRNAKVARVTFTQFLTDDALDGSVCHQAFTRTQVYAGDVMTNCADTANSYADFTNLQGAYDLLICNCEHFAWWCSTGEWKSEQAEATFKYLVHQQMDADVYAIACTPPLIVITRTILELAQPTEAALLRQQALRQFIEPWKLRAVTNLQRVVEAFHNSEARENAKKRMDQVAERVLSTFHNLIEVQREAHLNEKQADELDAILGLNRHKPECSLM